MARAGSERAAKLQCASCTFADEPSGNDEHDVSDVHPCAVKCDYDALDQSVNITFRHLAKDGECTVCHEPMPIFVNLNERPKLQN